MADLKSVLKSNNVDWKAFPTPHLKVDFFAAVLKLNSESNNGNILSAYEE